MIEGYSSGKSRDRKWFLAISSVLVVTLLIAARGILLPFVLALVVAYVLLPAVRKVEQRKVPRWGAILIVYAVTLSIIGGFVSLIVPRLIVEGQSLANELPRMTTRIRDEVLPKIDAKINELTGNKVKASSDPAIQAPAPTSKESPISILKREDGSYEVSISDKLHLRQKSEGLWGIEQAQSEHNVSSAAALQNGFNKGVNYIKENALTLLKIGQEIVGAISRGIFNFFMTLMLAAYLMISHEKIFEFFRELWLPSSRESFDRFMRRLDRGLSGVVRGQLLICLVNGILSAIGFWIFNLKYWPILSILAAVMSLIPIFGSILSSIPAVAIGLTQSPATGLIILLWILGIHQIEANFLNPKIIGDSAKIHPVLVVFSLLVGEHFFQITGALFAVPCMSIAQTIFLHFRESTMGLPDPLASIPPQTRGAGGKTPMPDSIHLALESKPTDKDPIA